MNSSQPSKGYPLWRTAYAVFLGIMFYSFVDVSISNLILGWFGKEEVFLCQELEKGFVCRDTIIDKE